MHKAGAIMRQKTPDPIMGTFTKERITILPLFQKGETDAYTDYGCHIN